MAAERIPVACAFHSDVVAGAADLLSAELADATVTAPDLPVWSNTTARPYGPDPAAVRELLARQVAEPVRFVDQIEAMYASGVRIFVEAGPGRVLSGLVGRILGDRPHTAVPLDVRGEHGLTRLVTAVAELAAAGVPVDPEPLFRGRAAVLPAKAPRRPGWLVDGHLVRTADGVPVAGGLQPARRVEAPVPAAADDRREDAVLEYLRGARELVAAQRDVLLGYLGASDAASSPEREVAPREFAPRHTAEETAPGRAVPAPAGSDDRPLTPAQLLDAVLEIIHIRTGYPHEMLDPALDLEADLSVDSIKRVEIIGALADRIGLPSGAGGAEESAVEELARIKTISGIVDWIVARGTTTTGHGTTVAEGAVITAEPGRAAGPDGGRAGGDKVPLPAAASVPLTRLLVVGAQAVEDVDEGLKAGRGD
ncbi:type I polyketide synthase, partial [Streptomyces sp. NPDC051098]